MRLTAHRSEAENQIEWRYRPISALHLCLHVLHSENVTFTFTFTIATAIVIVVVVVVVVVVVAVVVVVVVVVIVVCPI